MFKNPRQHQEQCYKENIDILIGKTTNAYQASLPLIASAQLKDQRLYYITLTTAIRSLDNLDNNPSPLANNTWMHNSGFKAWMWGRILLAAKQMYDRPHIAEAQTKIETLLNAETLNDPHLAFYTWARAYLADLNADEYQKQRTAMMQGANQLTEKYNALHTHDNLSNAVWAWVMNMQAAADHGDKATVQTINAKLLELTDKKTLAEALTSALTRSESNNDYPAWALVIVLKAANTLQDHDLVESLIQPTTDAIHLANKTGELAEYTIASSARDLIKILPTMSRDKRLTS